MSPSRTLTNCVGVLSSLLVLALPAHSSAEAADFGGDCCADLEERIAELEATTARKGNRKVSLSVTGQVSQALLSWDDGGAQDTYQVTNSNSSNRLRFDGSAQISPEFTAGYYLELGMNSPSSSGVSQRTDESGDGAPNLRHSMWYLQSKSLGSVSVGLGAPATDGIIGYNLGGHSVAADSDTAAFGGGLFTRDSGTGTLNSRSSGNTISLRWRRFLEKLDTSRANIVRYDSPVFRGLAVSASYGEDDFWDVSLRYAKKFDRFRFAAGAGYYRQTDEDEDTFGWPRGGDRDPEGPSGNTEISEWKGSASLIHEPTGLFVSGAYVHREFGGTDLGTVTFACFTSADAVAIRAQGVECQNRPDFDYYWVSGGIKHKFIDLGWTSIYAEYGRSEDAVTGLNVSVRSALGGDIDYVTSSTMELWGAGIVQHVSSAQMDLFVSYRHFTADVTGLESTGAAISAPLEDTDLVLMGSRIRF